MENNNGSFYKPTMRYNEFMVLELLHDDHTITQRTLCNHLGLSVASVNSYLDSLEERQYLKRERLSSKTVYYHLTARGVKRKNYLKISYFKSLREMYQTSRDNIINFIKDITGSEKNRLLRYGAGEVAEMIVQVIKDEPTHALEIVAIIDDDLTKQGTTLYGFPIIAYDAIDKFPHDGILIASYTLNRLHLIEQFSYGVC